MDRSRALKGVSGIYHIYRIGGDPREEWVGQAKDFYARLKQHIGDFGRGHNSPYFQHAWEKHGGEDFFEFEILEIVSNLADLNAREQHYLDTHAPLYNLARVAGSRLGLKHSPLGKFHLRQAWIRRRKCGHSPQRIAAYNQMRGIQQPYQMAALEMAYDWMRMRREELDQHVYSLLQATGMDLLHLLVGPQRLANDCAEPFGIPAYTLYRSIRRLRRQGLLHLTDHGSPRVKRGYKLNEARREIAMNNLAKAHEAIERIRTKTGHMPNWGKPWSPAKRESWEREKAEGMSPNRQAYWDRMKGTTIDDIGGSRLERYLAKKDRIIAALKEQGWYPDVPHGHWATARRIASLVVASEGNTAAILKKMDADGELVFHIPSFIPKPGRRKKPLVETPHVDHPTPPPFTPPPTLHQPTLFADDPP